MSHATGIHRCSEVIRKIAAVGPWQHGTYKTIRENKNYTIYIYVQVQNRRCSWIYFQCNTSRHLHVFFFSGFPQVKDLCRRSKFAKLRIARQGSHGVYSLSCTCQTLQAGRCRSAEYPCFLTMVVAAGSIWNLECAYFILLRY